MTTDIILPSKVLIDKPKQKYIAISLKAFNFVYQLRPNLTYVVLKYSYPTRGEYSLKLFLYFKKDVMRYDDESNQRRCNIEKPDQTCSNRSNNDGNIKENCDTSYIKM